VPLSNGHPRVIVHPMLGQRRLLFASVVAVIAACGSRTGLIVLPGEGADAAPDVFQRHDDAAMQEEDAAEEDALPPIDVQPPPIDAFNDCPDAGSTLIYVITTSNTLMSFYPPTATFATIGTIACPAQPGSEPFSMAVDRTGIAYTVFSPSGELFRVSTLTADCQPTTFQQDQQGFSTTFGMGYSKDLNDSAETLYVSSDIGTGCDMTLASQLGSIDTTAFTLSVVGTFSPSINCAELTGTREGQLFAFYPINANNDSAIGQIDRTTAQVTNQSNLIGVKQGGGWAFAFWGGDFYTFTAPPPANTTVVTRFRPSDGSITEVAQSTERVVGAGVSTCAPQM